MQIVRWGGEAPKISLSKLGGQQTEKRTEKARAEEKKKKKGGGLYLKKKVVKYMGTTNLRFGSKTERRGRGAVNACRKKQRRHPIKP